MNPSRLILFLGLALCLPLTSCLHGSSSTSAGDPVAISVVVTDAGGNPIGATVRVSWMEQGSRNWTGGETVLCDGQGGAKLRTGRFRHGMHSRVRVHVEAPGYSSADREWGGCRGGDEMSWDCILDPGAPMFGFLFSAVGPVLIPLR